MAKCDLCRSCMPVCPNSPTPPLSPGRTLLSRAKMAPRTGSDRRCAGRISLRGRWRYQHDRLHYRGLAEPGMAHGLADGPDLEHRALRHLELRDLGLTGAGQRPVKRPERAARPEARDGKG